MPPGATGATGWWSVTNGDNFRQNNRNIFTLQWGLHQTGRRAIKDTAELTSPGPGSITDLEAEYREESTTWHWSVTETKTELKKLPLSYWYDIDSLIWGLETLDVVIMSDQGQSHVSRVLPGPEEASHTVVYYMVRSEDTTGRLSLVWNILLLNITRGSR